MYMWHICDCSCLSSLAQLCPFSESRHFEANSSSQMFPGSLHWLYTVPLGQTMLFLFLLGLFSRPTAALCPISKEIPLQGNVVQWYPPWLSLHNFLQFRVVLQSSSKARGMLKVPALPKVFPGRSVCGYKITASCGCPRNPPKVQQSGRRGVVSKFPSPRDASSMGHWHGHYSLSSQCMPKESSEPHIHTRVKSADKNHLDVIKAEEQWLPSTRLSFSPKVFKLHTIFPKGMY